MTEKTETSDSSAVTDSRLRLLYVAGIALNVIALASAVRAGELLIAVTFVVVLAYLCFRYWTTRTS
jgi:Flp pilus assembly protein TadB